MESECTNIVIVVLDTTRAANLSLYGYGRPTSPNLERIAENSTVFENAISPSPWTMPAHASVLSGLYPSHHETTRSNPQFSESIDFLPTILSDHGYETQCITANKLLFRDNKLQNEFDRSVLTTRRLPTETNEEIYNGLRESYDGFSTKSLSTLVKFVQNNESSFKDFGNVLDEYSRGKILPEDNVMSARNNLSEFKNVFSTSEKNFILLNFMDTHLEYTPSSKFLKHVLPKDLSPSDLTDINQDSRSYNYANAFSMSDEDFRRLTVLYDGACRTVDHYIGQLYDYLLETNQFDNTLFVILGDHGENLGENGKMGHSLSLNHYVCHVPLIVSFPEQQEAERVESLVQTHDIFRSIIDVANIDSEVLDGQQKEDSQPLPFKDSSHSRSFAIAEYLGSPFQGIKQTMDDYPNINYEQYDYELKTVYNNDGIKLTTKSTDEKWLKNTISDAEFKVGHNKELAKSLETRLFDSVKRFGETKKTDHGTQIEKTLKDLGYI